jgi:radical SAM protein with 4Fe4S-binding SPASM domain
MTDYVRRVVAPDKPLLPRLGALDIELTERCDNDCIHCCVNLPAGDAEARARELTTEQWKEVLRQAVDLGCLEVRFTGGEPLLRTDFEELYEYVRRLGLKVLLFTNARQLGVGRDGSGGRGERLADLLAGMPPLVPLEVSVYGMRRTSYEAVTRVSGSFEQFQRGVRRLLERGIPFIVKSVLLPPNRDEKNELEAWALSSVGMTRPPDYALYLELRNRRDDSAKNELIASLRLSPEEVLSVLASDELRFRKEKATFASRFMRPPGDALFQCGAGRAVSIDAYGRAQPCLSLRAPQLSVDVFRIDEDGGGSSGLAGALDAFAALNARRAENPDYLRRCARCFLHGFCEQCPARSWSENGTLDTPIEYFCGMAHAQARFLGWLRPEERAWDVTDWQARVGKPGA